MSLLANRYPSRERYKTDFCLPNAQHQWTTDAINHFLGAILFEEANGKRHYCGHASGQFKDVQKHYHTIYKEILAVKYGISKFDFHLKTKNFIIEMDNSSFPKVLEFHNKLLPNP
ncbi:hypothetical protein Ddye_005431 [Dipteronia dyeriana]|uniref:Reverse transcriptase RNase H-like domain-containing protein n=1 Tax=Dipteronia dyeriana TaxID=168575 RepID=A0AAD9XH37_9ROSI|nr:hypothetical protein Ddye_005431 [Dipteronia dyeriana]